MGLGDRLFARLADQLRGPHGLFGRVVARRLNDANRVGITAAIDRLDPAVGSTVADVGFGGGIGLELLLERVRPGGVVHGVDPMPDMVRRAQRRHPQPVDEGHLVLATGELARLPLGDEALDGLITCNTIYFVDDLAPSFAELARVVRPGGAAVIGMADPAELRSRPFADHGFVIREVNEVGNLLEAAGFGGVSVDAVDIGRGAFHLLRAQR